VKGGAGGRWRFVGGGEDGNGAEAGLSLGNRLENGHAFGADGQAIGSIFNIASGDNLAVHGLQGGADLEVREGSVGIPPNFESGFQQAADRVARLAGHSFASWLMVNALSAH